MSTLSHQVRQYSPSLIEAFEAFAKNDAGNLPRARSLMSTGRLDAYAYDHGAAVFAEGCCEATGDCTGFVATLGQFVGAGGDVGGVGLVAGAGDG